MFVILIQILPLIHPSLNNLIPSLDTNINCNNMASNALNPNPHSNPNLFTSGNAGIGSSRTEYSSLGRVKLSARTKPLSSNRGFLSASCSASSASLKKQISSLVLPIKRADDENSSCLPQVWREIQGSHNWENLVQPLNPLLRDEIIRYGEFLTACYKAFDLDPSSKRYLNCKYGKNNMLREVGMEGWGYEVTKYIYATPDINIPTQNGTCCSRWMGYVAVSSDEEAKRLGRRDILVTFRGTVTNTEWIANFMSSLTPARLDPQDSLPNVKVESGFLNLYTSDDSTCKFGVGSCREQLLSEISRVIKKYKGEEMSITLAGHSMGSSLAVLLAYDIAELGLNKIESPPMPSLNLSNREVVVPVTVYSFGGPRVGNSGFKDRCEELGVKVLRIVNKNDPVTKLPGVFLNENFRVLGGKYELPWSCSCYAHLGVELSLDFFKVQDPSCVHDLDTYIKLLRCPTEKMLEVQYSNGIDLLNKTKQKLLCTARKSIGTWPWRSAAKNVGNLVQSLIRT